MKKIIFVTGTDTGVGKTVLTGLLLAHLRGQGCDALAMKPFGSGGRGDARLLLGLQKGCLMLDEVNPYYYDKPVTPAAAPNPVAFKDVVSRISALSDRCQVLLVEGAGGLLSPLGKNYSARELISELECQPIIVSRNRLGTINHTLLTVEAMQSVVKEQFAVVLIDSGKPDASSSTNGKILRQKLGKTPLFSIPKLNFYRISPREIEDSATFLKKVLARLV
jgi:dethiobiotin synthetase